MATCGCTFEKKPSIILDDYLAAGAVTYQ